MMVRLGKVFILTVVCVLVSGILFSSQVADEQVVNASITSFSEYMPGGKTADSVLIEMAAAGHEYQPDEIFGAEFGTAGFIGETERGPETPQLVTSFEEYARIYGSHPGRSFMPYEVKGYFDNGGRRLYIARVISQTAETAQAGLKRGKKNACTVRAINAGEWGNRVAVKVLQGMNSTESDPTFTLEVLCFTRNKFISMKSNKPDPALADIIEVYNDVSLNEGSPYYYENVVNQNSVLIRMDIAEDNDGSIIPDAADKPIWLSGGSDGDVPVLEDFLGSDGLDAKASTGLKALEKITTVSTLYSPVSCQYDGLDQALIQQCEALGDRTVILDTAFDDPHPTPWSCLISSYVSCYSPWIQITGPDSKDIMVPPGGFIAGLYARNDYVKGPDKLPVNEVLVGVTGVEIQLSPQARKALSIRRINPITEIPGIGYVVDEFMTLSDLADDYGSLSFRRYINFIRDSISTSLFWVSGQEWTQDLQSTIKLSIEDFLDREWKRGALLGSTQIEAYYVKVDPQQTADREGLRPSVAIEVGVALKEPSQFFVFSIIK